MQGGGGFQTFARTGLERLGVEVDDVELAVMEAADSLYSTHVDALLGAELDDVEPEPRIDLAEGPAGDPAAPGRAAEDAAGR